MKEERLGTGMGPGMSMVWVLVIGISSQPCIFEEVSSSNHNLLVPRSGHRFNSYYFLTFFSLSILEFMRYSSLSPPSSSPVLLSLGTVILSRPFSLLNNLHPYCAVSVSPIRVDLLCCTCHSSLYLIFLCYVILLKSYNIWYECNMLFSIFFDSIR